MKIIFNLFCAIEISANAGVAQGVILKIVNFFVSVNESKKYFFLNYCHINGSLYSKF